jgi:uncharacterized membrane protein
MTLKDTFYGWRVVAAAFVLAVFGWGLGFYGPPVYLHAVREARGWPLALVSTAVTVHFLVGAAVVANLPTLYRRLGVPTVTKAGALSLAVGVFGWAVAVSPWQLFAASSLSGAGWVALGAAAVNAIVSPWFQRTRPPALNMAYNGASIGGVVFSPLWVAAIDALGFPIAAALIGIVTVLTMWVLADSLFSRTPQQMGLTPDGDAVGAPVASLTSPNAKPLPGSLLWRDFTFLTLSVGMALGLFAQIGLIAHLFSLLVPALGAQLAGLAMGAATAAAIAGSIAFIVAAGANVPLLLLGVILFGVGIGNATSLPPLIAQVEFTSDDVPRVVSLIVAVAQASYAFAPAAFGLIREFTSAASAEAPSFFIVAALIQGLAICAYLAGRRR